MKIKVGQYTVETQGYAVLGEGGKSRRGTRITIESTDRVHIVDWRGFLRRPTITTYFKDKEGNLI